MAANSLKEKKKAIHTYIYIYMCHVCVCGCGCVQKIVEIRSQQNKTFKTFMCQEKLVLNAFTFLHITSGCLWPQRLGIWAALALAARSCSLRKGWSDLAPLRLVWGLVFYVWFVVGSIQLARS